MDGNVYYSALTYRNISDILANCDISSTKGQTVKTNIRLAYVSLIALSLAWAATAEATDRPTVDRGKGISVQPAPAAPARVGVARPMPGRPMPGRPGAEMPGEKKWNESEYVFTAKLTGVDAGPVANSMPPIHSHALHFTVDKVLRGPLKSGEKITCSHSARQNDPPKFPEGKTCLVAAAKTRGRLQAKIVELSTPEKLKKVTLACSLPLGWKIDGGKPLSPWAGMGKDAWDAKIDTKAPLSCSVTGRPALMVGPKAEFTVEKVPPKVDVKWSNPDGDGEYKVTVSNPTDKPITVPALLRQDGKILWAESLVILCQGKVYTCPGCKPVSSKVEPTKIEPGESVSTVVNTFKLKGPQWPRGGYRIEFQFCLGEKSVVKSFYYRSKHHDPIREAVNK